MNRIKRRGTMRSDKVARVASLRAALWTRNLAASGVEDDNGTILKLFNRHNGAELRVVGTAHVSEASAEQVKRTIREYQPCTVMVELCQSRAEKLRRQLEKGHGGTMEEILRLMIGPGTVGTKALQLGLGMFYRFFRSAGMDPGQEMIAAMQEADRIGAHLVYGDQDVRFTLSKLQQALSAADILKILQPQPVPEELKQLLGDSKDLKSAVERMKNREAVRLMAEGMRKQLPHVVRIMLDERDEYMAKVLHNMHGRVVAVVGLAHLDGIEKNWASLEGSPSG